MAEDNSATPGDSTPNPTAGPLARSRSRRRGRVGTSVGVVIAGHQPAEAAGLVADVQDLLPTGTRQEYLVLDDHTSAVRRELVEALEGAGDAMRLVPRPSGGPAVELDALAISCGSEFMLLVIGADPPLTAVEPLMEMMWSRGSDAGVALADGQGAVGNVGSSFTKYVGLVGPSRDDALESAGSGGTLGGTVPGALGSRLVIVRRWVARWVFSETERALDAAEEVADRAVLLGLDLLVVDRAGAPIR